MWIFINSLYYQLMINSHKIDFAAVFLRDYREQINYLWYQMQRTNYVFQIYYFQFVLSGINPFDAIFDATISHRHESHDGQNP